MSRDGAVVSGSARPPSDDAAPRTRPRGARTGPTRAEVVSTVAVVVLVALAVVALWPRGAAEAPRDTAPVAASDADLAPLRATAGLAPCPAAPSEVPVAGPLAGVTVGCLGAPGALDLGAAVAGRRTVLNLWASWCGPCRAELPALVEYAGRSDALPVLLVDVDDDPAAALRLLADLGVTLPSALDTGTAVRAALGAPAGLPYTYLVRADGSAALVDPPVPFRSADDVAAAVARLAG